MAGGVSKWLLTLIEQLTDSTVLSLPGGICAGTIRFRHALSDRINWC